MCMYAEVLVGKSMSMSVFDHICLGFVAVFITPNTQALVMIRSCISSDGYRRNGSR